MSDSNFRAGEMGLPPPSDTHVHLHASASTLDAEKVREFVESPAFCSAMKRRIANLGDTERKPDVLERIATALEKLAGIGTR